MHHISAESDGVHLPDARIESPPFHKIHSLNRLLLETRKLGAFTPDEIAAFYASLEGVTPPGYLNFM